MSTQNTPAIRAIDWIILGILALILLLVLQSPSKQSDPASQSDTSLALSKVADSIKSKDYQAAHDMLLVAFRLSPTDPRLLDSVESFVNSAIASNSDDAVAFAEDLVGRGNALVSFQGPRSVADARKRVTELENKLSGGETVAEPPSPASNIEDMLALASDTNAKTSVRSNAAQQARTMLEDLETSLAVEAPTDDSSIASERLEQLRSKIDSVELACIGLIYAESQSEATAWQNLVGSLVQRVDQMTENDFPALDTDLERTITDGADLTQELSPFAKTKTGDAVQVLDSLTKKIDELQRMRSWAYNKKTLDLIRRLEGDKGMPPQQKLGFLAEVREEVLSSYILRRHNELWEKLFEPLKEDEKVKAVKARVLRTKGA